MAVARKVKSPDWNRILLTLLAGIAAWVALAGCSPTDTVTQETDERGYRRGKSLLREGRKEEALQAFLSVISSRADAAESNLEAGLIYLNQIKDPLAAIYHFRAYMALNPDGEHAPFVKELILTAQRDFAKTLPGEPFGDAVERVNLMEKVKSLQEENNSLKEQVIRLRNELTDSEGVILQYREALAQRQQQQSGDPQDVAPIIIQTTREEEGRSADQTPSTYKVQAGDTLSRISNRVYGESGRWMDIFQANRDQLPSPNALKPGQVLRIP